MLELWRWFGEKDTVSLMDIVQAGAEGVVSALHHIPSGQIWSKQEIEQRQAQIRDGSGGRLDWRLVESLPVSEAIKTQSSDYAAHLEAYRRSLQALANAGLQTICYNFMPVLDWTRTELRAPMPHGGNAMRFDWPSFAAFDLFILERKNAEASYSPEIQEQAKAAYAAMDAARIEKISHTIGAGLPGSADIWSLKTLAEALENYANIDREKLFQHHVDFLCEVAPTAERLGLKLCCHPDDPPFPLMGLPRIMSSGADYARLFDAVDSPAVGMTFCTGSLGANPQNDCPSIAREFGPKIFFAHLRNVTCEKKQAPCSFFEDEHLAGQTDMVAVVAALLAEEDRRKAAGRADDQIPMRPDHGHEILADIGVEGQPGYPAIGRLKGLAELRGVAAGLRGQYHYRPHKFGAMS